MVASALARHCLPCGSVKRAWNVALTGQTKSNSRHLIPLTKMEIYIQGQPDPSRHTRRTCEVREGR